MIPVWLGIVGVLAALGLLLGGVRWYQARFAPPPEIPRKLVHVAMGLIVLSFPWVFAERWPVVVLGVLATGALLAVRFVRVLRRGVGSVLHSVERQSLGELAFPASVALVFWLANGNAVAYVVPVLMLALADATAAVIGIRYGVVRFATTEEPKSLEGSVAFFVVAFLSALVPLLLMTDIGRAEVLLIATILGLLIAMIEAVSWHGLDNLFVPVGTYVFLAVHTPLHWPQLLARLGVLVLLVIAALAWRRWTTLGHRAVVQAALLAYLFWVLGGVAWVLAPVALFFTYAFVPPLSAEERALPHDSRVVASNVAVGLLWVFVAVLTGRPELLYVFTVAFAAHLSENSVNRLLRRYGTWPTGSQLAVAVLKAAGFILLPWAVFARLPIAQLTPLLGAGVFTCVLAGGAAQWLESVRGSDPQDVPRGWIQAGVAFAMSLLALAALLAVIPGAV